MEYGTKSRLLRVLIALQENTFGYTKRQLAEIYGVSIDTIEHDFNAIRNAGFDINYNNITYKYKINDTRASS